MKEKVYFVQVGVSYSSPCFLPYSVGCIVAYLKKDGYVSEHYEIPDIIVMREKISDVIKRFDNPSYVAFSCYTWNLEYNKTLAAELKKKYPDAKVRIYAQDTDLLSVSNASLISIPSELVSDWYGPYLTKKANGDYTFSQEIKDSIMFEYHDCKNTNALPMVDIVFARDILSLLDEKSQESVVADFLEKMKGNAVAFVGDNETMPSSFGFGEKSVGNFVAYNKD